MSVFSKNIGTESDLKPVDQVDLRRKQSQACPIPQKGQWVQGKGIYVGVWAPVDFRGKSLGKVFDLYAAPEDLKSDDGSNLLLPFNKAVKHVASLRNWNGHDGGKFKNEQAVIKAAQDDPEALKHWFIPSLEIINGIDLKPGKMRDYNTLLAIRDKMPCESSRFVSNGNSSYSNKLLHNDAWYWSCTENLGDRSLTYIVNIMNLHTESYLRKYAGYSVRPVRAELRQP